MNTIYFKSSALLFALFCLVSCANFEKSKKDNGEVKIGTQIWAVRNLDVTHFKNGDTILEAKTAEEWQKAGDSSIAAWCYYDNDSLNGKKYGKLYNWYAVNDRRGLATNGWHIPDEEEWTILIEYLGGTDAAGIQLKTTEGWNNEGNGTNTSGFCGLPGGYRYNNGSFNGIEKFGSWWSIVESGSQNAWYRYLSAADGKIMRKVDDRRDGFSVRCLKN